ncbi:hypothetical protein [Streptosporangium sp. V21-05]|uniref:hypothetical protein n=1 Tax=Streptosporangium sp. V21-05 TaxID=3446115 RepID=UPI003F52F452
MSEETFLEGVKKKSSGEGDGRVDVWTSFLGDVTSQGSVSVDELETLRVVPGDIIVLYGMFDEGVHVMIASGGSSTEGLQVYSLAANNPTNYLTEATLTAIIKPYRSLDVSCVRVFSLKQELLI